MLTSRPTARSRAQHLAGSLAAGGVRHLLATLAAGRLTVRLPHGPAAMAWGGAPGPHAEIRLARWRALPRLLAGGDVGLAESYVAGEWSSPDLLAVLLLGLANETALPRWIAAGGLARWLRRRRHARRANTPAGSRRNVMAHYDLGNAFYAAWLDAGMSYSAALYEGGARSLEEAQVAKQDRVLAMLAPRAGDRMLEIGCGWGHMLERLAAYGTATGLTLSPAQAAHARTRLRAAAGGGAARVELRDYREITGVFDRIVSIEMLEAVGVVHWGTYFRTVARSLAAGGRAVIQTITIAEARFAAYAATPDFIQMHVFPGGMLPTMAAIEHHAAAAGLAITARHRFGADYARTLAEWRARFEHAWPAIRAQGFDERFGRLWRYYLAYCEAGFRHGAIDVVLFTLEPA